MQCSCAINTLAVFIRSVTHFDVETSIRSASNQKSLFLLWKKHIFPYQQRQTHSGVHFRRSYGAHLAPGPALSNGEGITGIARKLSSESVLIGDIDSSNHAPNKQKEQTVSKARNMGQQSATIMPGTNKSEFEPMKGLGLSTRKFINNDEVPEHEIVPADIDTLVIGQPRTTHQKERIVDHFHETNLPKFGRGVTPGLISSSMDLSRRQKHDPKDKRSSMLVSTGDKQKKTVSLRELWQTQKAALNEKFKDGWNPRKRLSPDALAGIRAIHAQFPDQYPTRVLAEKFEVSPEAIRRILKSKWAPKEAEELDRQRRWFSRGTKVWGRYVELGFKPPVRWRKLGIRKRSNLVRNRGQASRVGTKITLSKGRPQSQKVQR